MVTDAKAFVEVYIIFKVERIGKVSLRLFTISYVTAKVLEWKKNKQKKLNQIDGYLLVSQM